jgi:hypothetical protein
MSWPPEPTPPPLVFFAQRPCAGSASRLFAPSRASASRSYRATPIHSAPIAFRFCALGVGFARLCDGFARFCTVLCRFFPPQSHPFQCLTPSRRNTYAHPPSKPPPPPLVFFALPRVPRLSAARYSEPRTASSQRAILNHAHHLPNPPRPRHRHHPRPIHHHRPNPTHPECHPPPRQRAYPTRKNP